MRRKDEEKERQTIPLAMFFVFKRICGKDYKSFDDVFSFTNSVGPLYFGVASALRVTAPSTIFVNPGPNFNFLVAELFGKPRFLVTLAISGA